MILGSPYNGAGALGVGQRVELAFVGSILDWRPAPRRMWWSSGLNVMNNSKLIEWNALVSSGGRQRVGVRMLRVELGHPRAALGRPPKLFGDGACGRAGVW